MDQCVTEVQAEPDGDDQSDDRLTHGGRLLKLPQGVRVCAYQRQNRATNRHERDIEHDPLLASAFPTADRRKLSTPNRGGVVRISIRPGAALISQERNPHSRAPAVAGSARRRSAALIRIVQ
jgi:hypothetical protein